MIPVMSESNRMSTTSDVVEYKSFLLDYSTYDIEKELFYGKEQISDKEFPQKKKIILKILDGKVYRVVDQKLPTSNIK